MKIMYYKIGDVYSDVLIHYPDGKEQIVTMTTAELKKRLLVLRLIAKGVAEEDLIELEKLIRISIELDNVLDEK